MQWLTTHCGHTGTIQPVYRNATSYNGMTIATELGMAPSNSEGSDGSLTGVHHVPTTWHDPKHQPIRVRQACHGIEFGICCGSLSAAASSVGGLAWSLRMLASGHGQLRCPLGNACNLDTAYCSLPLGCQAAMFAMSCLIVPGISHPWHSQVLCSVNTPVGLSVSRPTARSNVRSKLPES